MKRVLVVVNGGVADYVSDDGIDVHVFDFDNYRDDPAGTEKVPAEFADLAAPFGAPVERAAPTQRAAEHATPEQVAQAREMYADDDVMIDDDAQVSEAENGVWVQAWVWVGEDDDDEA